MIMQGAFDDVTLHWAGTAYVIPARAMMGAIARIEDHVTMPELQRFGERGTVPMSRLSAAFASVLQYAGAKGVTTEDVYSAMFGADGGGTQQEVATAVGVLMGMMVPRHARGNVAKAIKEAEDSGGGNSIPTANASSKKRTSSRSGKGGSRRRNSGN